LHLEVKPARGGRAEAKIDASPDLNFNWRGGASRPPARAVPYAKIVPKDLRNAVRRFLR